MMHRPVAYATLLALLAVLALAAVPAMAKEGFEAQLDAPLSLDTSPGTTIEVGFRVARIDASGSHPMVGSPVVVRLVPPGGGQPVEASGAERPSGSGHYIASITVPEGGIAEVVVGLRSESCDAAGCQRSDVLFPLTDDALVLGVPSTASTAASVGVGAALVPISAIATAIALAAGLATVIAGRHRSPDPDPASH